LLHLPAAAAAGAGSGRVGESSSSSTDAALQARAVAGVEQVLRGFPDVDHVCIVAHVH
jgi:broad specificity phosphatase PhoE